MISAKHEIKSTLALMGKNCGDLADCAGIKREELSMYLNEKRTPTPEKFERLRAAYKELTGYTLPDLGENK
tara:strand:- start:1520 stop:1732 length:213 start_codon:yes stop_codon:yes gene_type:complete